LGTKIEQRRAGFEELHPAGPEPVATNSLLPVWRLSRGFRNVTRLAEISDAGQAVRFEIARVGTEMVALAGIMAAL
jgi:hypothetical protein